MDKETDAEVKRLVGEWARSLTEKERLDMAGEIAMLVGKKLKQFYRFESGQWWLYSRGKRLKKLTEDDVQWHRKMKHFPSCPFDGCEIDPSSFSQEEWFGEAK